MPLPALASAVLGSPVIGGLVNGISSIFTNKSNADINREQREWQAQQNDLQRKWQAGENSLDRGQQNYWNQRSLDWQEKMWNLQNQYNSPSAMMQRYKEANLNPYLAQATGNQVGSAPASSAGSPSVSSSPAGSPSGMGSAPNAIPMQSPRFEVLDALGVSANVANQHANTQKQKWQTASQIFQEIGPQAYYHYIRSNPDMTLGDPETSLVSRMYKANIAETEQKAANANLDYALNKEFGPKERAQGIAKGEYIISEAVGRLNTMRIQNDALLKRVANETVVSLAQAFNLRKQGDYYEASAETVNGLRQFIIETARAQSVMTGNEEYYSNVYKEGFENAAGFITSQEGKRLRGSQAEFDLNERGDHTHRFIQMTLEDLGNLVHVSGVDVTGAYKGFNQNYNWSNSNSQNKNYNYNINGNMKK